MNELISVIVPIYNCQKYLKRCLDSIANQLYKNIQVILIDDGSTDKTADICKDYCEKDERFIYYHQSNQGVSVARNLGLKYAAGRYITFVDADDWIDKHMYETMLQYMIQNNADSIICDVYETDDYNSRADTLDTEKDGLILKDNISVHDLNLIAGAVWRCIFLKDVVNEIHGFPVGLKLSEDRIFCIKAFGCSKSIYYLKKPFYYRYNREGSAVYSFHPDMKEIQIYAYKEMAQSLNKYWDVSFVSIAEKYIAVNSLEIFVSLCDSRTNKSFYKKYLSVKEVCKSSEIQNLCKKQIGFNGRMWRLVKKDRYFMVTLYAWLIGVKRKLKKQR